MNQNKSKFKNFVLYGGISKEEYSQVRPLILANDLKTWRVASVFLEILFLTMFIISIVYEQFKGFAPYFGILAVYMILLVLILLVGINEKSKMLMPILYLTNIVIIGCTMSASIYAGSNIAANVAFCAVLVSVSFFTIDKPYRFASLILAAGVAYFLCTGFKDYSLLQNATDQAIAQSQLFYDLFLGAIFLVISLFISMYMHFTIIKHLGVLSVTEKERDTDALTGVKNSIAYDRAVEEISDKIKRQTDFKFAIAVFDINGLKVMNDTYGHSHGDDLIIRTAKLICSAFKHSPVYRIGGDEFTVIITDEDYAKKEQISRELRERIEELHKSAKSPLEDTSVAFGIAVYSKQNDYDYVTIFARADADMYDNKRLIKSKNVPSGQKISA